MQGAPRRSSLQAIGIDVIAGLIGIGIVIAIGLSASAANALSSGSASSGGLELLCVDSCPSLIGHTTYDGSPIAFEWGARVRLDGLDIRIEATGDVHILTGPILAATSIDLLAKRLVRVGDGMQIEVREEFRIEVPIAGAPVSKDGRVQVDLGDRLSSRDETAIRGDDANLAALTSKQFATQIFPGLAISRDGDVYLDISGIRLGRLEVRAGGEIHLDSAALVAVPETGTALLLGLGLIARSILRPGVLGCSPRSGRHVCGNASVNH